MTKAVEYAKQIFNTWLQHREMAPAQFKLKGFDATTQTLTMQYLPITEGCPSGTLELTLQFMLQDIAVGEALEAAETAPHKKRCE